MSLGFDKSLEPVSLIASRWKLIAAACVTAVSVALVVTLVLLPVRFTAVTRLFIEPPAGSDTRAATAVSPVYLESLHSYELFALSDTLFAQAVERFGLRRYSKSIDGLKKSVLKIDIPRSTKVLEIRVTLDDPKTAHAVALFLAQETVKLNETLGRQSDRDLVAEAETQAGAAKARLDRAQRAWEASPALVHGDDLHSAIAADEALRSSLRKELADLEMQDPAGGGARAREITAYRQRLRQLDTQLLVNRKRLNTGSAQTESLEAETEVARRGLLAAESRLQESRSSSGYRGERLRIIDPGVVPERPSSPDLPLNLIVAFLAGFVASVAFVLLTASSRHD